MIALIVFPATYFQNINLNKALAATVSTASPHDIFIKGNNVTQNASTDEQNNPIYSENDGGKIQDDVFLNYLLQLSVSGSLPGEIVDIKKKLEAGENPRDFKLKLAYEIVKTFLDEKSAIQGQKYFEKVIQSKDKPQDMLEIKPKKYDLVSSLLESGFCGTSSEVRRLVESGSVKINDTKAKVYDQEVKSGDIIQKGKRFFVKIK